MRRFAVAYTSRPQHRRLAGPHPRGGASGLRRADDRERREPEAADHALGAGQQDPIHRRARKWIERRRCRQDCRAGRQGASGKSFILVPVDLPSAFPVRRLQGRRHRRRTGRCAAASTLRRNSAGRWPPEHCHAVHRHRRVCLWHRQGLRDKRLPADYRQPAAVHAGLHHLRPALVRSDLSLLRDRA